MEAAAAHWWIWPLALFAVSFAIGIVAVLGVTVIAIALVIAASKEVYGGAVESDALGAALRMKGDFEDPAAGARIDWRTHRTIAGFGAFGAIGFLGGLFGLGAGFANVPALNLLMAAPLKVAVGSSGLIISVINSSAAWVYIHHGALLPILAVPAILGVMLGSRIGARLLAGARALLRGLGLWM